MRKFATITSAFLAVAIIAFVMVISLDVPFDFDNQTSKKAKKAAVKEADSEQQMSERKKRIKGLTKMDSPNLFVEHERLIRTKDGDEGPKYEFNYRIKELLKANKVKSLKELTLKQNSFGKTSGYGFIERGPGNVSGRTRGLVVDPDDPNFDTWYSGSVGGGVWKTEDAGQTWAKITPDVGNLATSAIVQAPSNPDVLYIGTGEGFGNVDQIDGNGIWKTVDRGDNWEQLASTANLDFENVTRLLISPNNENVVLASTVAGFHHNSGTNTTSGIWRTTDGGENWTKVYESNSSVEHIIADPTNFSIQYATENALGVVKSTDGGITWNSSSTGLDAVARMEIAIAPSDPNRLYISAQGGSSGTGSTLFISRDAGASWVGGSEKEGEGFHWLGGQGWYDNTINVNPYNENEVYVGGINVWKIIVNADNTIETSIVTDGYGQFGGSSKGVHVDQHNIVMVKTDAPGQKFRMIVCNDGGVSYSDDSGDTFLHTENGYNTSQFYGIDKKNGSDEYIGGMQDNNTYQSPADPGALDSWTVKWGGDGYEAVWHYNEPNKIMVSSQFGNIGRSLDGGASYSRIDEDEGYGARGNGPFYTKLAQSKQDPDQVFALGSDGVWRTDDFGDSWTVTEMPVGFSGTSSFSQLKTSLVNPQIVWTAQSVSNNQGALVSIDGGFSFEFTEPLDFPMGRLTGLATHPTDQNTAYLLYSFAQNPKIVRTTDLGETWEDITGFLGTDSSTNGFPDVAVYSLVVMPYDTDIIWAGTGIGLFESTDNGETWHKANWGLPNVAIYQMMVVNDQVVAATHGRGIWTISIPDLDGYEPPVAPKAPKLNAVTYDGSRLTLSTQLRSAYDSTQIKVDDVILETFYNNTEVDSTIEIDFQPDSSKKIDIRLYSFINGLTALSQKQSLEVFSLKNPVTTYLTDFDDLPVSDFLGEGYEIYRLFGFLNPALHTVHDYVNNTEYIFTLLKPIRVSESDPRIIYSDIAIVEPGEEGSVFGDEDFYDYVVIEGSPNGIDWTPLAPGYDARYDSLWLAAWETPTLYRKLFRRHEIDISNTFNPGDSILIRFRMSTDDLEEGWGWAIDSLQIQEFLVGIEDLAYNVNSFSLKQNYPNPFNPTTRISFSLEKTGPVSLRIYDNTGRLVKTLLNNKTINAGALQQISWDGKNNNGNQVASGTFYYRLQSENNVSVKKMVLIR